jgi:hypothetical protein
MVEYLVVYSWQKSFDAAPQWAHLLHSLGSEVGQVEVTDLLPSLEYLSLGLKTASRLSDTPVENGAKDLFTCLESVGAHVQRFKIVTEDLTIHSELLSLRYTGLKLLTIDLAISTP